MSAIKHSAPFTCTRCLSRQSAVSRSNLSIRHLSTSTQLRSAANPQPTEEQRSPRQNEENKSEETQGALSRRLEEMTNESLESNPRRASKIVEESGFSEELKARLEARIVDGKIKADHPAAISILNMPSSAGQGTREQAMASPWTGEEKLGDAALRMLEDAHKPLGPGSRGKPKLPNLSVDTRLKRAATESSGQRLSNARDKVSAYSLTQDSRMSEEEKEEFRKTLRARFQPGARSVPASIQGLQSLASERIEDAIARGLFKDIPRGKGKNVERDHVASSPFIDTTEYFMNKIIQKQEVLPPWVEKQQEVTKQSAQLRSRLRKDWRRHAARVIASRGGSLTEQIKRAEAYAKAEELVNPRKVKQETIGTVDGPGSLTQVTVAEAPATNTEDGAQITVTESTTSEDSPQATHVETTAQTDSTASAVPPASSNTTPEEVLPAPYPFRDPEWEKTELSYHTLALKALNDTTRSYNLMAPELAKRPYFNLQRELNACFADVAPLVAGEIKERARAPPKKPAFENIGHTSGGVMERFSGQKVRVYESRKPTYGFKEFWKDLFTKEGQT